jgi:hypothetical protein
MTHPLLEAAAGFALVVAVGAGALMVWPQPRPEPTPQTIVLDVKAPEVARAEPTAQKSDVERVADLEREVRAIAEEHKRLRAQVKALAARAKGGKHDGDSR